MPSHANASFSRVVLLREDKEHTQRVWRNVQNMIGGNFPFGVIVRQPLLPWDGENLSLNSGEDDDNLTERENEADRPWP